MTVCGAQTGLTYDCVWSANRTDVWSAERTVCGAQIGLTCGAQI